MKAEALIQAARPISADMHPVESGAGKHLFVVDGSRFYDLETQDFILLRSALAEGRAADLLVGLGLERSPRIDDTPITDPPLHALSLAIAQKCNLGCTYCYAREGSFGSTPRNMPPEVAKRSVDLLLVGKERGSRVNLAFMGGEPLVNRAVLRETVLYARKAADNGDVRLSFSVTTNGTLVTAEDADFFEEHGFAVTVSLDGPAELHDRLRPMKGGRGSYDRLARNLALLLERQQRMQVSARVTVSSEHRDLPGILGSFVEMGFHSVGFSPLLHSPEGNGELSGAGLAQMLEEMIACGMEFERRTMAGERYPFANLLLALKEIHRGTHRPYPCGAGAGYLGVSAEGDLAACHRFVNDPVAGFGSVESGIDQRRQNEWLAERHVHHQSPCNACWARYLCGGGCHHETLGRERKACDYIRGWLLYSLGVYARLGTAKPAFFDAVDAVSI